MLPFHEHIVGELLQEDDGLVVIGAGLGLPSLLASLLRLHSASHGVVFILSASDPQRHAVKEELRAQDPAFQLPIDINNEYTATDRLAFYFQGGICFITSRILVVDLLNQRLPLHKIAGIVILNAHRLSETCTESFITRLYRAGNKKGFIRAFSDKPQAMIAGFAKTERIMRSLFVRRLHIWPRFQMSVASALEENPPEVIDIRIPLTSSMQGIHSSILEVMDACLKELRKTNKVDVEDLTIENGLFKSFDEIIRRQLDPIWHILGRKTKQLVSDLKTLRKLADYLVRYDAVTFLKYLDTLRVSQDVRSVWIFANPTHKIFEFAKRRVFQIVRSDSGNPIVVGGGDKGNVPFNKSGRGRGKGGRGRGAALRGGSSVQKSVPQENASGLSQGAKRRKPNNGSVLVGKESTDTQQDSGVAGKEGRPLEDRTISDRGAETEAGLDAGEVPGGDVQGVEVEVVVEEMPKWKVLREVLEEIEGERERSMSSGPDVTLSQDAWGDGAEVVLVACKDERTCLQLQDCITKGPQKLMNEEWEKYLLGKAELHGMRTRKKKRNQAIKGVGVLNGKASESSDAGNNGNACRQEEVALLAAAAQVAAREKEVIMLGDNSTGREAKAHGTGTGTGKGRVAKANPHSAREKKTGKGRPRGKANNPDKGAASVPVSDNGCTSRASEKTPGATYTKRSSDSLGDSSVFLEEIADEKVRYESKFMIEENKAERPCPPVHFYALESEQRILDVVRPSFVVVYDPDMAFVREMEVYKAEHPLKPLKVYFLFYENSTEAQKFEASIRRENSAFESLIRQKALMMIPVDRDGRMLDAAVPAQSPPSYALNAVTRKAGGRKAPEKHMQVVVDMREFGSSLPCVLHQQGIRILPVTLEVGDYILSPDICVERKSVSDLFASFASGRLYHQAETMTRYYRIPVLLIEFSQEKNFSLQSANEVGEDIIPANIISKLSLLVLHFPRLRIVWSRSLHATADIFITLKSNQDEPDVEKAMRVGVPTEDGLIEGDIRAENYNTTAVELLRRLPGVTDANYRSLMDGCKSLADLTYLSLDRLAELMGGQRPARMLRDFLDAKCPSLV